MKRHGQDDTQNQWAVHLERIQPGKSPRSEYTEKKRVHAQGISPYVSHTQGSEKVPGSTLKPPSKKKKKNLVDKTTNKSVFMPHKQQACSTCRTSHQPEREREKGVFLFKIPMDKKYSPTYLSTVSTIKAKLWQHRSYWYARGEGNNLSPVFSDAVAGEMGVYWTAQEEGRAEFPTPFPPLTTFSFCQKTPAENHFPFLSKHGSSKSAHFLGLESFL